MLSMTFLLHTKSHFSVTVQCFRAYLFHNGTHFIVLVNIHAYYETNRELELKVKVKQSS